MLVSIKYDRKECPVPEKVMAFKMIGHITAKIFIKN
jgi:hypothetical protein